jgi:hypothetical protein
MARLVYRGGSATDDNLTPRPGRDTITKPGQSPGLSAFIDLESAVEPGGEAQVIDLDLLAEPLRDFADLVGVEGSVAGHISIAPVTGEGHVDQVLLEDWARSRGSDSAHWLTMLIKEALIDTVRRPR